MGPNDKCANCGKVYQFINDETWNDQKAKNESIENFGEVGNAIMCDDCYKMFMMWYDRVRK